MFTCDKCIEANLGTCDGDSEFCDGSEYAECSNIDCLFYFYNCTDCDNKALVAVERALGKDYPKLEQHLKYIRLAWSNDAEIDQKLDTDRVLTWLDEAYLFEDGRRRHTPQWDRRIVVLATTELKKVLPPRPASV